MIKLGITGGIACGKSTATEYLKNKKHTIIFNVEQKNLKNFHPEQDGGEHIS